MYKGTRTLITGPMTSGKTEAVIDMIDALKANGHPILAFKHVKDVRYDRSVGKICYIVSHLKREREARKVDDPRDIVRAIEKESVLPYTVFIDEIQFFRESQIADVMRVSRELRSRGIHSVWSGLDRDFKRVPFELTQRLIHRVDEVRRLSATCVRCRRNAKYTQCLIDGKPAPQNAEVIVVEDSASRRAYEPRCRKCHKVSPPIEIVYAVRPDYES